MKKRNKTAAELMAELQGDPAFVARAQRQEQVRAREIEEIRAASAPVMAELAERGFHFSSPTELRERGGRYTDAVPVLLKWLPVVSNPYAKESLVRALSVPFAKSAAPVLVEEFRRASAAQSGLKWAIGNALSVVADETVFDDVAELVRDQRHGKAREMLAVALGNMSKASAAVDVLLDLLKDGEVAGHAIIALGKLKAGSAREAIEVFLKDPKPWVRKEAARALKAIGGRTN